VCDGDSQGWVLIALRNAFFELLHAESLETGVVNTVRRGGDTDTNAAIAGALLGAALGRAAVPAQWRNAVLSARAHQSRAKHPRPPEYWPVDCYELAERLLLAGRTSPL
jgi:ADP-ribosylglycohydrolase